MKINIKGKHYKLKLKNDTFINNSVAVDGIIDYRNKEISIVTKDEYAMPQIVLHELTHGYLYECGLEEYAHNEVLVDWIAKHIEDIAKSAAGVMKFIEKNKK